MQVRPFTYRPRIRETIVYEPPSTCWTAWIRAILFPWQENVPHGSPLHIPRRVCEDRVVRDAVPERCESEVHHIETRRGNQCVTPYSREPNVEIPLDGMWAGCGFSRERWEV